MADSPTDEVQDQGNPGPGDTLPHPKRKLKKKRKRSKPRKRSASVEGGKGAKDAEFVMPKPHRKKIKRKRRSRLSKQSAESGENPPDPDPDPDLAPAQNEMSNDTIDFEKAASLSETEEQKPVAKKRREGSSEDAARLSRVLTSKKKFRKRRNKKKLATVGPDLGAMNALFRKPTKVNPMGTFIHTADENGVPHQVLQHDRAAKREAQVVDKYDVHAWMETGVLSHSILNRRKFLHDQPLGLKHTRITFKYEQTPTALPPIVRFIFWTSNIWEWCLIAITVVQFYLLTYASVFQFFQTEIFYTVYVIDMIFLCDAVFRLALEVWRCEREVPCIVLQSPYTVLTFFADSASIIPIERIFILIAGTENLTYLGIYDFFRYNRMLRFTRIFGFLAAATKSRRISEKLNFFMKYFLIYIGFIQLCACIYHLFLHVEPIEMLIQVKKYEDLAGTWLEDMEDLKPGFDLTPFDFYTLAIYFSTAVVTTTGYGEVEAKSIVEMIFTIIVMLFGSIIFPGLFQSELANFELKLDGARFDLFFRLEAISQHLEEIKTSALFRKKVKQYYPLLWNFREGVLHVPFFKELPLSLQGDIKFDYCQEMFHKSSLFRGLDPSFLRAVAAKVEVVLYNPEMLLFAQGDYAMKMYYIIQGEAIAKSKFRSEAGGKTGGAVIRAGCIIGEINLFFSYPYTTTVWSRTCCQLLKIEKEELLSMLDDYPTILEIFRQRVQRRFNYLHEHHELKGHEPILWVEAKESLGFMVGANMPRNEFPVVMRWGSGFNRLVKEDVIDDTKGVVVFDMPCLDRKYQKRHTTVYETALVPNILITDTPWVHFWTGFTMILSMYNAFIEPYCMVFNSSSGVASLLCEFDFQIDYIYLVIYVFDVLVEITQSVPSTGLYYQLLDGYQVKKRQLWFWVDILAAIPLEPFSFGPLTHYFHLTTVILRCLKLWKVFRYFRYLDNVNPSQLFYFRLLQTAIVLLYATHFLACIYFFIACPAASRTDRPVCTNGSWLSSYHIKASSEETLDFRYLGQSMPYLLAFYFSCATLSSAGFGDFNPQSSQEVYSTIVFSLISFYIICYYTALLTSALSCTVRPRSYAYPPLNRLLFENKVGSVKQFMDHYGINEGLQTRVLEHYHLQSQFWNGVMLPPETCHYLYDTPEYLQDDALYIEVEELFDGIPLFSKLDPKLIVKISKLIRRYLIPPGVVFLRRAEVRRQMYVIGKGSVGVFADVVDYPLQVLEASSHFGIRDLMLGEPAHHHIKTLSYCLIYEIELRDLLTVLEKEPYLDLLITETKEMIQAHINAMVLEYSHRKATVYEEVREVRSWIQMPTQDVPIQNCTWDEFEETYAVVKFGWVFRLILLRKTVNPVGTFAKLWTIFMSIISYLQLLTLVTESFMPLRSPKFRGFQYTLDMFNIIDIYLRLHWAYYSKGKNHLISHPLMTAINYVFDGGFCYDVLFCFPFELLLAVGGFTDIGGYTGAVYWYTKFRWIRFGQVLRLPAVIEICHSIFVYRSFVLCMLYVMMTLFLCSALAAVASYISCPSGQSLWEPSNIAQLPLCEKGSWTFKKGALATIDVRERWVLGVYYVSQVLLGIGYGDMITLRKTELYFLIAMMVFGFMSMTCILADITAAEVELDEARLHFLEGMRRLKLIMSRERVHDSLTNNVMKHLTRTWEMSKGLQPNELFEDLHPALQSDVYRNFVGDQLMSVPIFNGLTDNVLRTLCQYLTKVFFLKGERLMRQGNLEQEMYIIVDGKVWICDDHLNWVCTIAAGETFGETNLLTESRRKYNAIAGSSVEMFALSADGFEDLLQRYPVVSTDLKRKLAKFGNKDLFERLITHRILDDELIKAQTKKINILLHSKDGNYNDDFETVNDLIHVDFVPRYLYNYGAEDEFLPFLYFATTKSKEFKFLIHPECGLHKCFMWLVIMLSVITPGFGVIYACFSEGENLLSIPWIKYTAIVMELPMYLHMLLCFITPVETDNGSYIKVFRIIAFNYVSSVTYFWFDLVASIPVYAIHDYHSSFKYLGFLRSLRLVHFYRVQLSKKDDITRSTFRYKVTISVISFLLMAHFLACMFYWLSPCPIMTVSPGVLKGVCAPESWTSHYVSDVGIVDTDIEDFETGKWYVRSLYFVVTTISTTGFGGITPHTIPEILWSILCIFCGSFALSIILSHFTSGIASLSKTHREYLYEVDILTKHYSNVGMSHLRKLEINAYFVNLWDSCRGVPYHKSTTLLPVTMRIEVCHALYHHVLGEVRLFQPYYDKAFLRQLCSRVEHAYILPGTNVVCEGDTGDSLYIVFRGTVGGYSTVHGSTVPKNAYCVSEVFGKAAAFFLESSYNQTYRAETDVEVLTLSQSQIMILAAYFPDFSYVLQSYIAKHYEAVEGRICIFEVSQEDEQRKKRIAEEEAAEERLRMAKWEEKAREESRLRKAQFKSQKKKGKKSRRSKSRSLRNDGSANTAPSHTNNSDDSIKLLANLQKLIVQVGSTYELEGQAKSNGEPFPGKKKKKKRKKKEQEKPKDVRALKFGRKKRPDIKRPIQGEPKPKERKKKEQTQSEPKSKPQNIEEEVKPTTGRKKSGEEAKSRERHKNGTESEPKPKGRKKSGEKKVTKPKGIMKKVVTGKEKGPENMEIGAKTEAEKPKKKVVLKQPRKLKPYKAPKKKTSVPAKHVRSWQSRW